MANKKISDLTSATSLTASDVFPLVQASTTKKAALSLIKEAVAPNVAEISIELPASWTADTGFSYQTFTQSGVYYNANQVCILQGAYTTAAGRSNFISAGIELYSASANTDTTRTDFVFRCYGSVPSEAITVKVVIIG